MSAGLSLAIQFARPAYVASSGAIDVALLGKVKKNINLVKKEQSTIAYNLLFKVVSRRLKSFMVVF